jgi:hypothetical protein
VETLLDAGSDVRALRCRPSTLTEAGDVFDVHALARQSADVEAPRHEFEIQLPGEERPVAAVAKVGHATADDLGLGFVRIEPDDRMRLEQAAITWHRARLRLGA